MLQVNLQMDESFVRAQNMNIPTWAINSNVEYYLWCIESTEQEQEEYKRIPRRKHHE